MRRLLLVALMVVAFATTSRAQSVATPQSWTGTEIIRLQSNSGSIGGITINHIRNTQGYLMVPGSGAVVSSPTWYSAIVAATGAPTTWTVNLPNPAPDGMVFTVSNTTTAALPSVTVQTQTGAQAQTLANAYAAQNLAANGGGASWLYTYTTPAIGVWQRIR